MTHFVSFRFVSKSATNSGDTDRIKIAFFTSFLQTYLPYRDLNVIYLNAAVTYGVIRNGVRFVLVHIHMHVCSQPSNTCSRDRKVCISSISVDRPPEFSLTKEIRWAFHEISLYAKRQNEIAK